MVKCYICDREIPEDEEYYIGGEGSRLEGEVLCESCYEDDEPEATVYYNGNHEEPYFIFSASNYTYWEGPYTFRTRWVSTDLWRGYYEAESDDMVRVFDFEILWGHESEEMVKKLRDRFVEEMEKEGIQFAEVYCRSSNLFFTGGELWIEKDAEKVMKATTILARIKAEVDYDNPIYHTGIVMPRENLKRLQELGFDVKTDEDLFKLFTERGGQIVDEIAKRMKEAE